MLLCTLYMYIVTFLMLLTLPVESAVAVYCIQIAVQNNIQNNIAVLQLLLYGMLLPPQLLLKALNYELTTADMF
jgi:hypothetical protein